MEKDEALLEAAKREFLEQTGYGSTENRLMSAL